MALTISVDEIVENSDNPLLAIQPHWKRVRLGEVASVLNGYAFKSSQFSNGKGMPLIRIRDVGGDTTDTNYTGDFEERYIVEPGDLLIGMDGDFNCARWRGPRALLNQRVCKVTLCSDQYLARFLDYALPGYLKAINDATSSVTVKHLSARTVEDIPLPLPSVAEQEEIVAEFEKQFSRLDEAVVSLRRVKANLKRYKASVLIAATEGRLVPIGAELALLEKRGNETASELIRRVLDDARTHWSGRGSYQEPTAVQQDRLPAVPAGWTWATVAQLAAPDANAITDGPFGSNLKTEHYEETGPRVIRLQNIGDGEFVNAEAHISVEHFQRLKKHEVHAGDLVIATLGGNPPRACVIPVYVGPAIVKADCIRFKPHPSITAAYINAALNAPPTRERTKDRLHGVGRPRLSLSEIKTIPLPIPPAEEQRRISAELDRVFSIVNDIDAGVGNRLIAAVRLRGGVLAAAFCPKVTNQRIPVVTPSQGSESATSGGRIDNAHPQSRRGLMMNAAKKNEDVRTVLEANPEWLSTTDLLQAAGFQPAADADEMERFYLQLRDLLLRSAPGIETRRRDGIDYFRRLADEA